jgi:TPR repeat protein
LKTTDHQSFAGLCMWTEIRSNTVPSTGLNPGHPGSRRVVDIARKNVLITIELIVFLGIFIWVIGCSGDRGNAALALDGKLCARCNTFWDSVSIGRAAHEGNAVAQYKLYVVISNAAYKTPNPDYTEARKWIRLAKAGFEEELTEKGSRYAQNAFLNLALMKENSDGSNEDYLGAVELYKKAAALGSAHACSHIGDLIHLGFAEGDDVDARKWYEKAITDGPDPDAQYNLGSFYLQGIGGLPKDTSQARRLIKAAAEQGNRFAQKDLEELK